MRLPKHMGRRALLLLLFLFICFRSVAATFVVTSNADSGPGTLREALTLAAANGSAEKDYINFSLPDLSEAGRTIVLSSQLPFIPSNLVIDGTTQPGLAFGVSSAKIILTSQQMGYGLGFCGLVLNKTDWFELYGFYIKDFNNTLYDNPPQNTPDVTAAILIEESSNIQIGAPGKGNVFINNGYITRTPYASITKYPAPASYGAYNMKIWSNFFGIKPDGKTISGEIFGGSGGIDIGLCKGEIEIGGDDQQKRNLFGNGINYIQHALSITGAAFPSNILIQNNYFDYDIDGKPTATPNVNTSFIMAINIGGYFPPGTFDKIIAPYNLTVLDNKIQYPQSIFISNISGDINFKRNSVKFEPDSYHAYDVSIVLQTDGKIAVGGLNNDEANDLFGSPLSLESPTSILIQHNSIYCVPGDAVWTGGSKAAALLPVVSITNVSATSVAGVAPPFSKVELFWDDDCERCQPLTYITTIDADASGNWRYNGNIKKGVIASATKNGFTSFFTTSAIYSDGKIAFATCNKNDGSITILQTQNAGGYTWKNDQNVILGHKAQLTGLSPGRYTLTVENGSCSNDYTFVILDATPKINITQKQVMQPSCGNQTGSITGIYLDNNDVLQADYGAYSYKWSDLNGDIKSTNLDLINAAAGFYMLEVSYKGKCPVTYGPVTLTNTTGATLDDSNPSITNTNCGQTVGSIKNILVTGGVGTRHFIWKNNQQQEVSYTQDLMGQPAGKYTLQVTDDTQCGPIYSKEIEILEVNGIALVESPTPTTPATCGKATGAVTGIKITGATKYEWRDADGNLKGTGIDLTNVPAGAYQLTASNAFCQKQSQVYQVLEPPGTVFPSNYIVNHIDACYGAANGGLQVNLDVLIKAVRWVNAGGVDVGVHYGVTDLPAGSYKLYLTDQNGCESYYNTYQVSSLPEFKVADNGLLANENCGLKNGYVNNVTVAGGLPPYNYKWLNADGIQIGATNSIATLAEGQYVLNVTDSRCGDVDIKYIIQNITQDVTPPSLSDIQVCTPGDALLTVNNAGANIIYRLYDQADSAAPLAEQTGGRFKVSATANRSFFVSAINGICESPKTEVKVSVGLSPVSIANTFSPNGDGSNDYWKINSIESYPAAVVQVFNRDGTKLFESKGYATPFNGSYNGKPLPAGTYYYIINLNKNCSLLSGSLTILR